MRAARLALGEDAFVPALHGPPAKLSSYGSFLDAGDSALLAAAQPAKQGRSFAAFAAHEEPSKATTKVLDLNDKIVNITRRLGETQLQDPASQSTEWEVNQKLCEEGECQESQAHVTVKECQLVRDKPDHKALPEGHWWEDDKDCRYVQLPLAMVFSAHGRCLSASAGSALTETCSPEAVNCGNVTDCNRCWLLQRATENNAFAGWKLKTACGGLKPPQELSQVMGELGLKKQKAKFLTMDADGEMKSTDEYTTEQDRQIWNLTPAEVSPKVPPEELHGKILQKPFMLENLASKRFLLHEKPPLDEHTAKTDPLNTYMAQLPDKDAMPEPFKNDTPEADVKTIINRKQWRRGFWRGAQKADSIYLQGQMMRGDGKGAPTFNFLSAAPDKGSDFIRHLRPETLSEDCQDRWTFVPKERGYELHTDCERPDYLVALNNGDGPVVFHKGPLAGPEGKWNLVFARPPPPEPPADTEEAPVEPLLPKPQEVPLEAEELAAQDPEKSGAAMDMVKEGDQEKAIEEAEENYK